MLKRKALMESILSNLYDFLKKISKNLSLIIEPKKAAVFISEQKNLPQAMKVRNFQIGVANKSKYIVRRFSKKQCCGDT